MNLQFTLSLTETRCWRCRRWYAYESSANQECPMCAHDRANELGKQIVQLKRSNAALRGAVTRKRRRK